MKVTCFVFSMLSVTAPNKRHDLYTDIDSLSARKTGLKYIVYEIIPLRIKMIAVFDPQYF